MIPTKLRTRRMKILKPPKIFERKYRDSKCRDCSVVVTRMDFAKILGKFTKVKIQYESSTTSKTKRGPNNVSSLTSLIKSNENGIVKSHRNSQLDQKTKPKKPEFSKPSNILKENNLIIRDYTRVPEKDILSETKHYGVVFQSPTIQNNDVKSQISLEDLLPDISEGILPSHHWCIEFFPKNNEPKDDKLYDRIAAELEVLMYNEKTQAKSDGKDDKVDDFPSIMDILNDNPKGNKMDQTNSIHLESNDVEAMLLGKPESKRQESMVIDNPDVNSFLTGVPPLSNIQGDAKTQETSTIDENPDSPSILDENSQKEPFPFPPVLSVSEKPECQEKNKTEALSGTSPTKKSHDDNKITGVTQVIFKKNYNGSCQKSVICPKNLKYSISILGKQIELIGAPKYISNLEDLEVLLQIVDECNLDSLYVHH